MTEQKNIALCISGQPRFYELCAPAIAAHIKKIRSNVDIFIHAWDTDTHYKGSAWAPTTEKIQNLYENLLRTYGPTEILIEKQKDDRFKKQTSRLKKNTEAEPYIQASMFYSIYMAGMMRRVHEMKTGIRYDGVIRTRFDYLILDDKTENHFINEYNDNTVYYADVIKNKKVVCDYWMAGAADVMEKIEDSYFHMFKKNNIFERLKICGEEIITDLVEEQKIKRKPITTKGALVRDKGLSMRDFGKWS